MGRQLRSRRRVRRPSARQRTTSRGSSAWVARAGRGFPSPVGQRENLARSSPGWWRVRSDIARKWIRGGRGEELKDCGSSHRCAPVDGVSAADAEFCTLAATEEFGAKAARVFEGYAPEAAGGGGCGQPPSDGVPPPSEEGVEGEQATAAGRPPRCLSCPSSSARGCSCRSRGNPGSPGRCSRLMARGPIPACTMVLAASWIGPCPRMRNSEGWVFTSPSRLIVEQFFLRLFERSRAMSDSESANLEPTSVHPDGGASLEDVVLQNKAGGIALESVRDFMGGARFRRAFFLKGVYLFRVDGGVGDP
ncbi:unnamed protein product [Prorocentrum cordatum]|uniref:Uncharacterized protein n=1 Tax=Prorocentrum cordatum TaxID=2364126 RepID=A0ABN9UC37_9DINO|nr:unnamed protein product [Polarella glacialis]